MITDITGATAPDLTTATHFMHRSSPHPAPHLPPADPDARVHSEHLTAHLRALIRQNDGWLPFDQWMEQALYAPGLGYYAAGSAKLSPVSAGARVSAGDFITAPELSPFFGRTLAREAARILAACGSQHILEFGAGTGRLAEDVLTELRHLGISVRYSILEVSADLRQRQQARLAPWHDQVEWLDALPEAFSGCVLANEVLDAMPVKIVGWVADSDDLASPVQPVEYGITLDESEAFTWQFRPVNTALATIIEQRLLPYPGYRTEVNLQAEAWVAQMGRWLQRGAALLIDYGFPQHEYYHPQRASGTLMCHYRHHAHPDPLLLPGLQDITAHVDFTAIADAALHAGLDVSGYTSQGRFLMNAGLPELLSELDPRETALYAQTIGPVQKLLGEAEMGELFKVLALSKGLPVPLQGFMRGDRRHTL